MRKQYAVLALAIALALPVSAKAVPVTISSQHQWTYTHNVDGYATSSEIVARDSQNRLWVVGPNGIDVLNANGSLALTIDTGSYGGANSVAIKDGRVAVAVTAPINTEAGKVLFYNEAGKLQQTVTVGANPDMVTFTTDGRLLVANEGEPSTPDNYKTTPNPAGSISIVGTDYSVTTAGFGAWNDKKSELATAGVRLFPTGTVEENLEPEYIAVAPDGKTAYVTLQENNSLAIVDLETNQVKELVALGTKDHSIEGNGLDVSDNDGKKGNIATWPVKGMYMPDAIASYETGGQSYLVTANEGDAKGEEKRMTNVTLDSTAFPNGPDLKKNTNLGRLDVSTLNGDTDGDGDYDELYSYGARSFSIWDTTGQLVWDSGDFIERYLNDNFPDLLDDTRSDNKGPEPEGVALLEAFGSTLAFIGLERSNAIMAFNITNPNAPNFLELIYHAGDKGPEGLLAYSDGSNYWLAVANEISMTTTLYNLNVQPVPEPATMLLFGSGLAGLGMLRRRKK